MQSKVTGQLHILLPTQNLIFNLWTKLTINSHTCLILLYQLKWYWSIFFFNNANKTASSHLILCLKDENLWLTTWKVYLTRYQPCYCLICWLSRTTTLAIISLLTDLKFALSNIRAGRSGFDRALTPSLPPPSKAGFRRQLVLFHHSARSEEGSLYLSYPHHKLHRSNSGLYHQQHHITISSYFLKSKG